MGDEFMQSGVAGDVVTDAGVSEKSKSTAAVLCFFLGWLGVHRFYVGKIGTGILLIVTNMICWLITALTLFVVPVGLVTSIWVIIDFIMILTGGFKDVHGNNLK